MGMVLVDYNLRNKTHNSYAHIGNKSNWFNQNLGQHLIEILVITVKEIQQIFGVIVLDIPQNRP